MRDLLFLLLLLTVVAFGFGAVYYSSYELLLVAFAVWCFMIHAFMKYAKGE